MLRYGPIAKHVDDLRNDGYTILPGLLDPGLTTVLREEVLEVIRETRPPFPQLQQSSQYLRHSALDRLINSDELLHLAGLLCDGPCMRFLPFTAVKAPGGSNFQFHQDNQYRPFDGLGINFWFALQDIDESNGCLWIVPGSHRAGPVDWVPTGEPNESRTIPWEPVDARPVPMAGGDCIVFDRLTIHGSGSNHTDLPRIAYSVTFHREDVSFLDEGEWKPLKTHSRWRTGPRDEIRRYEDMPRGGER